MEPPVKPNESDCCNSGCNPCILDVYEDQMKKYKASLKVAQGPNRNCFSPTSYSVFRLIDITKYSRDCNLYQFKYVRPQNKSTDSQANDKSVIYEPGQHFLLKGEGAQKAYTPIYVENQDSNCFTVLVKLYENGHMSGLFRQLTVDSETLWRGPYGDFRINYEEKNTLLVAQGTGIAPFYSVLCDVLNNEECYTFFTLFFCCNVENVLLRNELYKLGEFWNFKYELFVSGGDKNTLPEKYNEIIHFSRLEIEKIDGFLKNLQSNVKVLICGSENFCDNIKNMLVQCEVSNEAIIIF